MSIVSARGASEYTIFIPEGGSPFILDQASGRFVLTEEGTGLPPIEYVTERGPFQDGETVRGFFLRPSVISLRIRNNFCSRDEYWVGRSELLNAINPTRGTNGTLRRILSNGVTRDITCVIQAGPGFQARKLDAWDEWAFDEMLRFVCFNPTWYNPAVQSVLWVSPTCDSDPNIFPYTFPFLFTLETCPLVFPITFPIVFQSFGAGLQISVNYRGNWKEYPTFVITGPVSTIVITNLTTNEKISLSYPVLVGEVVTIVLTYGLKSITLSDGTNLIPYLTQDSDLATFHLEPGVNSILIQGYGTGGPTTLSMNYYERYIGLGG